MLIRLFSLFVTSFLLTAPAAAQHYRGLCAVNDTLVWMSGSKGFVVRTNNGGLTWDTLNPKGFGRKDFRDIHAWNDKEAVVMSSGDSAVLLQTKNGGKTWKIILKDYRPNSGVFWDAIDVREKDIVLVGDASWAGDYYFQMRFGTSKFRRLRFRGHLERFTPGETSFFAASGSNVQWLDQNRFACIPLDNTNNGTSRFERFSIEEHRFGYRIKHNEMCYVSLDGADLPFKHQTGGAYSMYLGENGIGACVGGSYLKPDDGDSAACYTRDSGRTWHLPQSMPGGYRSCVTFVKNSQQGICTGTNGTDMTTDGGINWKSTNIKGYNVCAYTQNHIWFAGNKGSWEKVKLQDVQLK